MATFEIEHPTGGRYQVEAPDEQSAIDAINEHVSGIGGGKYAQPKMQPSQSNTQNVPFAWDAMMNKLRTGQGQPVPGSAVKELKAIGGELVKGVPMGGTYMPQTQEMTEFEQQHPTLSTMARIEGGTAATLPFGMGVSGLAAKTAYPLALNAVGQTALGAGLSTGDVVAEKGGWGNISNDDIVKALMYGGGFGAIGPAVGKLITPTSKAGLDAFKGYRDYVSNKQEALEKVARARMDAAQVRLSQANAGGDPAKIAAAQARVEAENVRFETAGTKAYEGLMNLPQAPIPPWLAHTVDAGVGAAAGHLAAGPGGAVIGALTANRFGIPSGSDLVHHMAKTNLGQQWLTNQWANNPMNAAILSALAQSSVRGLDQPASAQ